MKLDLKSIRGFTLIELMIVVTIIGILSATVVPSYNEYKNKAKVAEALVLAGYISTYQKTYYNANGRFAMGGGYLQTFASLVGGATHVSADMADHWREMGSPFRVGQKINFVPMVVATSYKNGNWNGPYPVDQPLFSMQNGKAGCSHISVIMSGQTGMGSIVTPVTLGMDDSPTSNYDFYVTVLFTSFASSAILSNYIDVDAMSAKSCHYVIQYTEIGNGLSDFRSSPIIQLHK